MENQILDANGVPTLSAARIGWTPARVESAGGVARWVWHPPVLAAGLVLAWVLLALLTNTAQYGDHFEQFSWAQSMEWGYHKHPPLPSWMLAVAIQLGGMQVWWPSVLACGCIALNLVLTWRIACWLVGEDRAALAVLFAGLQQGFMFKAQLFNHNSVMVLCVSAATLLALRATQHPRNDPSIPPTLGQTGRWVALGVVASCALLSKYQAALPLMGLVVSMWRSGVLQQPAHRRGLALAIALTLLLLAPHMAWVVTHGWSTIAYATQAGVSQSLPERLGSIVKFLVIQVRVLAPALLLVASVAWWTRGRAVASGPAARSMTRSRDWLIGLLGVPLVGVLVAALMGGLRLQDHWGIQTFQFLGIAVAAWWPRAVRPDWRRWTTVALVLHGVFALSYVAPRLTDRMGSTRPRLDQFYPAQGMADAVAQAWTRSVPAGCPLRFVRGPGFEAGIVGIYASAHPAVVDDVVLHTPWLRPSELLEAGHVEVRLGTPPALDEWSPGPVLRGSFSFDVPAQQNTPHQTLHWMVVPPTRCATP